jgi:hypothetical protein
MNVYVLLANVQVVLVAVIKPRTAPVVIIVNVLNVNVKTNVNALIAIVKRNALVKNASVLIVNVIKHVNALTVSVLIANVIHYNVNVTIVNNRLNRLNRLNIRLFNINVY